MNCRLISGFHISPNSPSPVKAHYFAHLSRFINNAGTRDLQLYVIIESNLLTYGDESLVLKELGEQKNSRVAGPGDKKANSLCCGS